MPSTQEALLIFMLAVLPGALYIWAFEREVGKWGIGLADRVFRFIAASAVFQLVFALATAAVADHLTYQRLLFRTGGDLPLAQELRLVPEWKLLLAAATYIFAPLVAGTAAAAVERRRSTGGGWKVAARVVNGRDPAPRAWDFLFAPRPGGVLRARLKSGDWIGGIFGAESYAAGYPEEPQDLFIERAFLMTDEGEFVYEDEEQVELGSSILVRWDEVEFLEFFTAPVEG